MKLTRMISHFQLPFDWIVRWFFYSAWVGVIVGCAVALFVRSLDWVTHFRQDHLWIVALLPISGLFLGWVYHRLGQHVEGGNDLILDEIHQPRSTLPLRMAPLVLFGTLFTHLFGGSAGREGTAFQMGGALADQLNQVFKLDSENRRILLMAGLSAGFSAVFGTPLAGAVFGIEVLTLGWVKYDQALWPCLIAALIGSQVAQCLGVKEPSHLMSVVPMMSLLGLFSAIVAGIAFGITGRLFANLTHFTSRLFKEKIHYPPFRPLVGGGLVAAAVFIGGSTRYIGLGIPVIEEALHSHVAGRGWDFVLKMLFTSVTLGSGFKGGEVTPLFFVGSTLGKSLSLFLPLPSGLLAALGFVGVFAGAANTPLAATLVAIEIFGSHVGLYAGVACITSYLFSGHPGIYRAQRKSGIKIN